MSQMPLEALGERLLDAGVAPRHVRLYLSELRQHFDDLLHAEISNGLTGDTAIRVARARLGNEEALASAMLAKPELRSLTVRAPWLVFGITPIFLTCAMAALLLLLTIAAGWLGGAVQQIDAQAAPAWFRVLCQSTALMTTFLVPPLAASVLVMLAMRQRMRLPWPLIGSAVIGVFSVNMCATFPAPGMPGGSIGLSFPIMPVLDVFQGNAFQVQWSLFTGQLGLSLLPAHWLMVRRLRTAPSPAG